MLNTQRRQFLATVAELYYKENQSQAEIARKLGYSRSAISRLLTEARNHGLVEIRINYPLQRASKSERALEAIFPIRQAMVVDRGTLDYSQALRLMGELGANYLEEQLPEEGVLAITWGTGVKTVGDALQPRQLPGLNVVQMIGSVGSGDPSIDGHEVARLFANKLGARYFTVSAPNIVKDARTRDIIMSEESIKRTLDLASQAKLAVVGIGSTHQERSGLLRSGYITPEEVSSSREQGAVGDICSMHFDENGHILPISINSRVIGMDIRRLRDNGCLVLAIAGGQRKGPAILGALRGGFVDVLVTDSSAASMLLAMNEAL